MPPYDPKKIEEKWNKKWLAEKVFKAADDSAKPKYYQLETFPYPSAAGLHMGHPKGYTAEDIHARYTRMHGREVLYTMGWDAFGLPTENYAIKVGRNPRDIAKENTDNFRRQVQMFGFSYDWDREIDTSSPEYYKWTQWLFIQLFKKGLAYRKDAKVNWCPKDQTVLANEQVIDGKCERCGTEIEERMMEQWFLKITDYADRLLADLNGLDWPAATIKRQEDWIGRSEGAELIFPLNWQAPKMDLVFATNNVGKFKRMQKLFAAAGFDIVLKMPADIGIKDFDVVEDGQMIAENAEKKARALAKLTDLPVLADDTGFFIDGAEVDPVTVKRNALGGADEKSLTVEQIAEKMQAYYKAIATARGGKVDAEWRQALCFVTPEKAMVYEEAIRPVALTNEMHGTLDPSLPLRGLYIPKPTGKYTSEETEEEELLELKPITDAIKKLFTPSIRIFTTRPDTLFGATYLVLAPEHPFVDGCIKQKAITNIDEVAEYVELSSHKTERMRQEDVKDKTGVELKGVKAINPATGIEIPIWVADYVLGSYGTGAIMAVPAHDERDFEFAKKFGLEIKEVIVQETGVVHPNEERRDGGCAVIFDPETQKYAVAKHPDGLVRLFAGGVDEKEDLEKGVLREVTEESGLYDFAYTEKIRSCFTHYYNRRKKVYRSAMATCFLAILKSRAVQAQKLEPHEQGFELIWMTPQEIVENWNAHNQNHDVDHWFIFLREAVARAIELGYDHTSKAGDFRAKIFSGYGGLINSGKFTGMDSKKAKAEITASVDGKMKTQYKIRDWSVSRQRYWGAPIPMIHCPKDGIVPVPESELPVVLPDLENYRPQGMPPLASSLSFISVKCPQCGGDAKRDAETLDTFVDSSWYFLRYPDSHNATAIFDKQKVAHWMPVDLYVIGAEHTVMHLLYSRFITKFLYDEGYISFVEPFKKMRHIGLIMGVDGAKMSKSKGNVVNPDEIVAEFSADAMRMYLMFLGPFYEATPWDAKGILGVERFLKRFWKYCNDVLEQKMPVSNVPTPAGATEKPSVTNALHRTIKKVGEDIEAFKFNTAISSLMILLNELEAAAPLTNDELVSLIKIVHPFVPHMAQELWSLTGATTYVDFESWPVYDLALIAQEKITIVFQVNGKTKDTVSVDAAIDEAVAKEMALASEKVKIAIAAAGGASGQPPKRVIYVDKKLVNIVV
jgi:leucyl-tRNA synthetase